MSNNSTNEIIQQIRSGDTTALEQLYSHLNEPFVIWMYQKYQCKEADALDIYQESILVMYRNILSGQLTKFNSSIKTYLYAIAKNIWFVKQKKINHGKNYQNTLINKSEVDISQNPQHQLESNNLHAVVKQYINSLEEPCKSLLTLSLVYEKNTDEMLRHFNYKNKHVLYTQKNRCLKKLQALINQQFSREDF